MLFRLFIFIDDYTHLTVASAGEFNTNSNCRIENHDPERRIDRGLKACRSLIGFKERAARYAKYGPYYMLEYELGRAARNVELCQEYRNAERLAEMIKATVKYYNAQYKAASEASLPHPGYVPKFDYWDDWYTHINCTTDIELLGQILYTGNSVEFLVVGLLLFTAVVGSVSLVNQKPANKKHKPFCKKEKNKKEKN